MNRRTLLVHPQGLWRCALRELLIIQRLTESVDTVLTTDAAIDSTTRNNPDLIIYCDTANGNDGADALRRLRERHPTVPVLVIGERDHPMLIRQWLSAGANGFILTNHDVDDLKRAFAALAKGENFVPGALAQAITFSDHPFSAAADLNSLSRRELQVLLHVVEGGSIREISQRLCISPKTVGTYRHRLFRKLNVRNDAELTQFAVRKGLTSNSGGAALVDQTHPRSL